MVDNEESVGAWDMFSRSGRIGYDTLEEVYKFIGI